jgi:hypothetical protein
MPAAVWIIGVLVIGAIIAFPTWLIYTTVWLPRAQTRDFIAVLTTGDIARVRSRMSPQTRDSSTDENVRGWCDGAKGYEDIDWGSKTKMGSTPGGRTRVSTQGYLRYPGTPKERWFSISFVKDEGEWYVLAFSLGSLAEPY